MFRDRWEAGRRLAEALAKYRGRPDAVVLAVPRGGLPVGSVVARALGLPLDVMLTKKIGHPANPEVAVGAVALEGEEISPNAGELGVPEEYLSEQIGRLRAELRRRHQLYRGEALAIAGRTVLLVDDGAATGLTLKTAAAALKNAGAARVVVAVPVAPPDALPVLRSRADEVVCLEVPGDFRAVAQFYGDFSEVTDRQAVSILRSCAAAHSIS
ncbi:MAG: phosphoribosyltransferase [Elusimicrobiota bacterium]